MRRRIAYILLPVLGIKGLNSYYASVGIKKTHVMQEVKLKYLNFDIKKKLRQNVLPKFLCFSYRFFG